MNKRIQELAEQATTIVNMVGPQGYTSSYANFDKEKFAELIVRECMELVSANRDLAIEDGWNVDEAMSTSINDIEEHFGVTE
jgi:hypothetical protein